MVCDDDRWDGALWLCADVCALVVCDGCEAGDPSGILTVCPA